MTVRVVIPDPLTWNWARTHKGLPSGQVQSDSSRTLDFSVGDAVVVTHGSVWPAAAGVIENSDTFGTCGAA